mgnify:CR=1 FL=1
MKTSKRTKRVHYITNAVGTQDYIVPSETYQTTNFGYSTENGFGSIYHEHNNKS